MEAHKRRKAAAKKERISSKISVSRNNYFLIAVMNRFHDRDSTSLTNNVNGRQQHRDTLQFVKMLIFAEYALLLYIYIYIYIVRPLYIGKTIHNQRPQQ